MTYESKPMIENSDRGITLAKPLAWSMLCSVVAAVWWGGSTVSGLSTSIQTVTNVLTSLQAVNIQMDVRVRALESTSAASATRYEYLKQSLDEVKSQQGETNDLLRQILQGRKP